MKMCRASTFIVVTLCILSVFSFFFFSSFQSIPFRTTFAHKQHITLFKVLGILWFPQSSSVASKVNAVEARLLLFFFVNCLVLSIFKIEYVCAFYFLVILLIFCCIFVVRNNFIYSNVRLKRKSFRWLKTLTANLGLVFKTILELLVA